jgi:hypothetical protein
MDQPWLDALEDIAPPVQTAFLGPGQRLTRKDCARIHRARRASIRAIHVAKTSLK